jgi:hypothetical protein
VSDSEPREVFSAADAQEAHFIKAMLQEAGIEARVVGDHLQSASGELPAVTISPRIWVNADNFDQGRKIIADHQAHRQSSTLSVSQWTCAECGEPNEPSFEICWSCQTDHDREG